MPESIAYLKSRITTLDAQVQFCVDYMNEKGILEEGCFTFPDGETVHATQELAPESHPYTQIRGKCDEREYGDGGVRKCILNTRHEGYHEWGPWSG